MTKKKSKIKSIDCTEARSRFNRFLDSDLKAVSKKELETHISDCKECFERLEFEKLLKEKVNTLSKKGSSKSLLSRIEKTIASI